MGKIAAAGRDFRHWLVMFPRAVPAAIFLLTSAITGLSVFAIERTESEQHRAQLRQSAEEIGSALERRAAANTSYLRAGAALFATTDHVTPALFGRFVAELRLDSDFRGAESLGWAPLVGRSEAAGQGRVFPTLSDRQPFAVPVTFIEPDTEHNRRVIGFDMYSEPFRRAAMEKARATGRPIASGMVVLVQPGKHGSRGFLIYMPVFAQGPEGRQLRGFVYSPFYAAEFLASAIEARPATGLTVRIYDGAPGPARLLAESSRLHGEGKAAQTRVVIAGRPWTLEVEAARPRPLSTLSLVTLLFGLLVACLLMLLARLLTQQAIEDRAALDWLEEQNAIRNSLTRELNHRLKNTLANVLSIIALTSRRATDMASFIDGLNGRIRALSATHDLLLQSDWGTTPVRALIEAELAPYAYEGGQTVTLSGPEVGLAPGDALSLGLAIHELATNAAKYGALGAPGGTVTVDWHRHSDGLVRIDWSEAGGPGVPAERGRGFGTDLLEKIVAHELGTPVDLRFEPDGVKCSLSVPVREPTEFVIRASRTERPD